MNQSLHSCWRRPVSYTHLEAYADEQENTVRRLARKRLMQKPPRTEEDFLKAVKSLVSKGFPYEMAKRAVWELRDEYGSTNK